MMDDTEISLKMMFPTILLNFCI